MQRKHRLRTPADFLSARSAAPRAWSSPLLVAYVAQNDLGIPRFGIVVSGRVGKAVVRNKVRRRLREAVRARLAHVLPNVDVVLIARPQAAAATWADLNIALDQLLKRAGATKPAEASV